jgi:osmoprotectant transport system substrate-binding protein
VTIGDKNFTEQFVLGELYRQALQSQGFSVQLNRNIGPTDVTLQALKTGSLSMYPEYLNTFNTAIAHYSRTFQSRVAAYSAAQRYALAHGLELLAATPFSDTDAIGVTVGYAAANHLRSLPDLNRVAASLNVGGPPQFQSGQPGSPGLATVEQTYGFTVAGYKPLAVGDQYTALNDGTIRAAAVNTTDGQLASGNYRALGDPQHLFGWGNAVPVVTAGVLDAEGPAFADTIDRISALLTTPVMRQLNQAVDVAGQDPATVAKQFLETHGLIPPAP